HASSSSTCIVLETAQMRNNCNFKLLLPSGVFLREASTELNASLPNIWAIWKKAAGAGDPIRNFWTRKN
ncbi:hypothetical protein LTS12_028187, partial [Elasticomyces elasticus]